MKMEDVLKHFAESKEKCEIQLVNGETIISPILEVGDGVIHIDGGYINTQYIVYISACAVEKKYEEITKNKGVISTVRDFFFTFE